MDKYELADIRIRANYEKTRLKGLEYKRNQKAKRKKIVHDIVHGKKNPKSKLGSCYGFE